MTDVRYPACVVQLTGTDGNVFSIIGRVRIALRQHVRELGLGVHEANIRADQFTQEVKASESYDEALLVVMRWVTVE
jgi:hypothetical protein